MLGHLAQSPPDHECQIFGRFDEEYMRVLPSICTLALCMSCNGSLTPARVDFEVVTAASPIVARIGDSIAVTVTATNVSGRPQVLLTNDCITAFGVFDSAGRRIGPASEQFCLANAKPVTLGPGEQYSITQQWRGDALRSTSSSPPAVVEAGMYTVRGILPVGESVRTVDADVRLMP